MLEHVGVDVIESSSSDDPASTTDVAVIESTRSLWDIDRNTKIVLQRLLYIAVGLPMVMANDNGTWDTINGVVYPNSYKIIAIVVFIASQFMGTSKSSNNRNLKQNMIGDADDL